MPMSQRILLCTDLDCTLLPNGIEPESPCAREFFAHLVARPEVTLAYVSGRHRELVIDAIQEYSLPMPNWVVGDVGTTIYRINSNEWQPWHDWEQNIAVDWLSLTSYDLRPLFTDLADLRLQEEAKQNRYKLSYYLPLQTDLEALKLEMEQRLHIKNIASSLIYSTDESARTGLLDVLPMRATKRHAIEFLMYKQSFDFQNTVFAGDSGNDLPVLESGIKSVLVANSTEEVARQAQAISIKHGTEAALYLARGDFMGMNGNYSAGILEGIAHYLPYTRLWMEEDGG
jgi:HAD superfamily hydrolase (TIGR01484 family)